MGISTVTAARIRKGQLNGKLGEDEKLSFDKFPHVGLSKVGIAYPIISGCYKGKSSISIVIFVKTCLVVQNNWHISKS